MKATFGLQVSPGSSHEHLRDYIALRGFRRTFLVTGNHSYAWFEGDKFLDRLSGVTDFRHWIIRKSNPDFLDFEVGLEVMSAYDPDLVLGVGGGKVLDMAKLLGIAAKQPQFDLIQQSMNSDALNHRSVGLVLVPTTAGSGAEATHFSVLYRDGIKNSIAGNGLIPDFTVLDPHLVKGGSSKQVASSGLDALCQSIESLWAKGATTESRHMAREALGIITASLPGFLEDDIGAAERMQWGSHLAGHAINTSKTTAAHALSYFLTAKFGVPHGIAVASTLGYFIDDHINKADVGSAEERAIASELGIIQDALGISREVGAVSFFESLFYQLKLDPPRQYWPGSPQLTKEWLSSVNQERLNNHPIALRIQDLREILDLGP